MLKIAFVDHHLNNYHADTFVGLLRGPMANEGVQIVAAYESDPAGDKDWCKANDVPRADSVESAVRGADAVLLLAPDNIEAHLGLAQQVLPTGKPTYIDKLLAPTLSDARAIQSLAERYATPIFSASGLRFAVELVAMRDQLDGKPADEAAARGMGRWDGYGVHALSLAFAVMGHGVRRVIDTGSGPAGGHIVTLDYGASRRALVEVRAAENEWTAFPWSLAARPAGANRYATALVTDYSGFYVGVLREALSFFRSGKSVVTVDEMLTTVAVLEAANVSRERSGVWVPIDL